MSWIEHLHSTNWNLAGGICVGAYLLGCFTAGYYLVRFRLGRDIRESGSGNVGARNAGRVLGKAGFLLTLLVDFGKGSFAIWAARHFTTDERLVALAMLAVVAGHVWPVQLRFRGGKGMATSLGALLAFDGFLALAFAAMFIGLFGIFRKTVLPGLLGLACVPLVGMYLGHGLANVILISLVSGVVLLAHRRNLMEEIAQFARRNVSPKPDQTRL